MQIARLPSYSDRLFRQGESKTTFRATWRRRRPAFDPSLIPSCHVFLLIELEAFHS